MAVTIFAAIDVGSHETTLRIYEVSKKYGVHEIESVHHTAVSPPPARAHVCALSSWR